MANHNTGPGIQDGGMTVYYFQPVGGKLTAFPPVSGSKSCVNSSLTLINIPGIPYACRQSYAPPE